MQTFLSTYEMFRFASNSSKKIYIPTDTDFSLNATKWLEVYRNKFWMNKKDLNMQTILSDTPMQKKLQYCIYTYTSMQKKFQLTND